MMGVCRYYVEGSFFEVAKDEKTLHEKAVSLGFKDQLDIECFGDETYFIAGEKIFEWEDKTEVEFINGRCELKKNGAISYSIKASWIDTEDCLSTLIDEALKKETK